MPAPAMRCLPARAIAASPGIDEEVAEVTPEGKVQMADRLKAMGKLAFAGDRINDAPVPAEATVLSRATMAHIRQNPCWAFACIASLAPVAAGVLFPSFGIPLSPVLAAGAMAMSSVLVLTNALRLKRIGART